MLLASSIREVFSSWPPRDYNLNLVNAETLCLLFWASKVVGVCDALYSTVHGYTGANTAFCVGTAAIVRHSALLSTQLSLYSAAGVGTDYFSAVQALLDRLPTAGTCAALPQCC